MSDETIKRTIQLPLGFNAKLSQNSVAIKSPKGEISKSLKARGISMQLQGNSIVLQGSSLGKRTNALLNTIATHIQNMVNGLQQPYQYRLVVVYSHFPMNLAVKGNRVEINNFTGEKHPRHAKILPNVSVEIKGKEIFVKSSDRDAAGQTAANMENATKVKGGKDRRIYQDGIFIAEKPK